MRRREQRVIAVVTLVAMLVSGCGTAATPSMARSPAPTATRVIPPAPTLTSTPMQISSLRFNDIINDW
jgi:hypothetical protein